METEALEILKTFTIALFIILALIRRQGGF